MRHLDQRLAKQWHRRKHKGTWSVAGLNEFQWIGLRENLQESPIFNGKIYGFLFSLKPIQSEFGHWRWWLITTWWEKLQWCKNTMSTTMSTMSITKWFNGLKPQKPEVDITWWIRWFRSQPKMVMTWGSVYEKLGESHIIHWEKWILWFIVDITIES